MNIDLEKLKKSVKLLKKHEPKKLSPKAVELAMLCITIGVRINMLRSEGYSDEQIIEILKKGKAE